MSGNLKIAVLYEPSTDNEVVALGAPVEPPRPRPRHKAKRPAPRGTKRPPKLAREQVLDALQRLGHEPFLYSLEGEESLLGLAKCSADLVFNLAESFGGDDTKDVHVAAFLDLLEMRYTGSGPHGLYLGQDKALAKKIIGYHGVRTPSFVVAEGGDFELGAELSFPVIVKPCSADGSVGIDAGSVVHGRQDMLARARLIQDELRCPALIEQYIEGRELYIGILGNEPPVALPAVELDLSRLPQGMPHIAGREVKWATETQAYKVTRSAIAKDLDEQVAARAREASLGAYRALELRDYARIDLRLAADGKLYVIEANPNPWLVVEAEFALAAREAGRSYTELIGEIVAVALARYS
jgi:D-alanine-D-alanine ligase